MIFAWVISDNVEIIVCGTLWPGFRDGAPPPDWWEKGGAPIIDKRTKKDK